MVPLNCKLLMNIGDVFNNSLVYDLYSCCLIPHVGCQVGHHIAKGIEGAQRELKIKKVKFSISNIQDNRDF